MPIPIIDQKIAAGTYKELAEGLSGGCDERGEWERKCYLVAWSDRSNFIREMEGGSRTSGGIGGTWLPTNPYPLPDNPRLYAREVTFEPEGSLVPGVTPIAFTHARFSVTFRQPEFNYSGADDPGFLNSLSQDPAENDALLYATQELDFGKEWVQVPNSSVKFKSDGKSFNTSLSRSTTVITMMLTWHRYPVMPMGLVRNYPDSVNNAKFLGCDKGTVMFEGPRTVREATQGGQVTQKVMFVFKWREVDWNKVIREDSIFTTSWDYVVNKSYTTGSSDTYCKYAYRDFSKLLLKR